MEPPRWESHPPTMTAASRSSPPWRGFTVLELAVALSILGLLLSLALPIGRQLLDRWTVVAARDEALSALHRARSEARLRGGATLDFDGVLGRVSIRSADSTLWVGRSLQEYGVSLSLPNGAGRTAVELDALGLGVVASRTLVFRRGAAEARLVISSRARGTRR